MTNWQRLGYQHDFMDAVAQNEVRALELWWDGPPDLPDAVEGWASSAVPHGLRVFAMGWAGYIISQAPLDDWREAGRRAMAAAVYYFQGAWREKFCWLLRPLDRVSSRQVLPWIDTFREGLALSVAFGQWEAADRIIEWLGTDVHFDEGSFDRSREDNAYYIWLAARLRGETESSMIDQRQMAARPKKRDADEKRVIAHMIRRSDEPVPFLGKFAKGMPHRELVARGARRRPKMLLEAADALLAGHKEDLASALTKYLKHYRQREFDLQIVENAICIDATILWHWARRSGMGEIELPEELMKFIPRP